MKTKMPSLALGFLLGALSLLLMGQSRPPAATGRFTMLQLGNSVCVQDTATGVVKMIPAIEFSQPSRDPSAGKVMALGQPF